jgi:hypothetical protein
MHVTMTSRTGPRSAPSRCVQQHEAHGWRQPRVSPSQFSGVVTNTSAPARSPGSGTESPVKSEDARERGGGLPLEGPLADEGLHGGDVDDLAAVLRE